MMSVRVNVLVFVLLPALCCAMHHHKLRAEYGGPKALHEPKQSDGAGARAGLCTKPMDIAFLVDKSGSIGRKGLNTAKTLMNKIVDYLGMSNQGNHYAIMEFGKNPRIVVNFNTFTGDDVTSANLKLKIKQMNRIDWNGGSFIDRALLAANSQLFTVGAGMRQNATKVAFVLTDGIQTKNKGYYTPLHIAGGGLRQKSVKLISFGVGTDVDVTELWGISNELDTFAAPIKNLDPIASRVCPNSPTAVPTTSASLK